MNRFYTLLFILFSIHGFGQDQPKVGLVLSGGGAKGFAHVGALKVIEEAGIKIDYISGTSMGGLSLADCMLPAGELIRLIVSSTMKIFQP